MSRFVIIRKPTTTSIEPVARETAASWRANQREAVAQAVRAERHEDEGDAEPEGVGEQEHRSLADVRAQRGQADDAAEDRADAGGPAGGEHHAEQRRAAHPRCLLDDGAVRAALQEPAHVGAGAGLAAEHGQRDEAGHVQAHDDEHGAAELAQQADVVAQRVADQADGGPQGHEDDGEAQDERQRLPERGAAGRPCRSASLPTMKPT